VVLSGNGWRRREQALDAHGTVAARDHFYATIGIGKPSIQKEEALKFTEERLSEDWVWKRPKRLLKK
jgi:hypothetical protein